MHQINYTCYANRSGYAQAALDYIYAIRHLYDIRIKLLHTSPEQLSMTPQRYKEFNQMMRTPRRLGGVQIFHCIPDVQRRIIPHDKRCLGFATFETFDPPAEWADILNKNSGIICPSTFNAKIFEHAGVKVPIHIIPHCYDTASFNTDVEPREKDERFTFLFFGTWKKRKGYDAMLEAWLKEFDASDKVKLIIKTDRFTQANQAIERMKADLGLNKKETAPISFEGRVLNELELPRFLKSADCLVCPTLGEGFGLPGLQCMALGVPVVITNFSGCTEYAKEDTATLIEPENFILYGDMDNIPQFRNRKWANVTPTSVAKAMRYVLQNTDRIRDKAVYASKFVVDNFSYPIIASKFSAVVESLL